MRPPKRLGRFILLFAAVYAPLMVPWPGLHQAYAGVERAYAWYFRGLGNAAFSETFWLWPQATVHFLDLRSTDLRRQLQRLVPELPADFEPPTAQGVKDTLMALFNRDARGQFGLLRTSSRYVGYGPTVMIVALVLATPLAWRRRAWALLLGLLLIHLFILVRLTLTVTVNGFAADKVYALFHPGPFWQGVLTRAETMFSDDPTVSFVVPIVVWFVVTLRRSTDEGDDGAGATRDASSGGAADRGSPRAPKARTPHGTRR